ncbi:MAG: SPOR domain-containing protein [Burkholderiales bacterium]
MRLLFLLLLAANLALFAWMRFLSRPDPAIDRQPLAQQIEPDKLRIVSEEELARTPSPPAPKAAAPAKPAPAAPIAAPAPAAPVAAPPLVACLEWGSFNPTEEARAAKALEPLALGTRLSTRRGEETASWWVHMPPLGSRAAAQKKAAELRKLEVQDYFVVQDAGPQHWAISLGVFTTEVAAQARLASLRGQGVHSAVLGRRETRVPKAWFQVHDVGAPLREKLESLAKDFDGATLHECARRG